MNEELKMILEAMQGLSDVALWGFIVYLVVSKLLATLIAWAGGITLAYVAIKGVARIITNTARTIAITKQIRDSLGIGIDGCLWDKEIEKVQRVLPDMINAYKERKANDGSRKSENK